MLTAVLSRPNKGKVLSDGKMAAAVNCLQLPSFSGNFSLIEFVIALCSFYLPFQL